MTIYEIKCSHLIANIKFVFSYYTFKKEVRYDIIEQNLGGLSKP